MRRLPKQAKWELRGLRFLSGAAAAASNKGILEIDFKSRSGRIQWASRLARLPQLQRRSPFGKFTAQYTFTGSALSVNPLFQTGRIEGAMWDNGRLRMDFAGNGTSRRVVGKLIDHTNWTVKRVAILTPVGNPAYGWQTGPGHTALAADGYVYSFEGAGYFNPSRSGWNIYTVAEYIDRQRRPVVVQELDMNTVRASAVMSGIHWSMTRDEEWLVSATPGVCSSAVAQAIDWGIRERFEPAVTEADLARTMNPAMLKAARFFGNTDTPLSVYRTAKDLGIVKREYYIWDRSKTPTQHHQALQNKKMKEFVKVGPSRSVSTDIRSW